MTDVVVSGYLFSGFTILMPKRKARKSLFSSDDARRNKRRVLSMRLEMNGMKGCVLRGKGWLFQVVRIPKNIDVFVYDMMQ